MIDLFPIVKAQTVDASAQPTFGSIDVGGGSTVTASMLLSSDKTAVDIGEKFTVTVEIKTNTVTINEYRIVIDFDSTKLQVLDQDPSTPGIQIKLLDTIFVVENQETDNTVSQNGRITLIAKVDSGNPFTVNKNVAEIQFQAQAAGSPTIKIFKDASGSRLIRQSGVGVDFTPNGLTVQVKTATGAGTTTGSNPPPTNQTTTTTTTGGTTTTTTIPKTGVADDLGTALTVLAAAILIITGIKLSSEKKKKGEI
ncbi:MAG: hypothetical protein ACMG57_03290 [Candidatus Dojkabacteria bacterium]